MRALMDAPLQWLTPAESRRLPFPRWAMVPSAIALVICVVGKVGHLETVLMVGKVLASLGAVPVAWWLEESIYGWLGNRSTVTRLFVLAGVPFVIAE